MFVLVALLMALVSGFGCSTPNKKETESKKKHQANHSLPCPKGHQRPRDYYSPKEPSSPKEPKTRDPILNDEAGAKKNDVREGESANTPRWEMP